MMNFKCIFFAIFILVCCGCSTTKKSTILGMSVGIGVGGATGAITNKDQKGVLLGALAFGTIGGLSGYFGHKALEKRDLKVKKETIFNIEKYGNKNSQDFSLLEMNKTKDIYIVTEDMEFLNQ